MRIFAINNIKQKSQADPKGRPPWHPNRADSVKTFGLLATTGLEERVVGHALYVVPLDGDRADLGIAIAEDFQGRGLGTLLLGQLAEVAAVNGIRVFVAEMLPENHRMLEVLRESGFPVEVRAEPGQIRMTFATSLPPRARAHFEHREEIAAANALGWFFNPRAVAAIGASRDRGTIGGEIFANLVAYGFVGPVYPVNPAAEVVQGVRAYPSVDTIPDPVDLAVIAVPAAR